MLWLSTRVANKMMFTYNVVNLYPINDIINFLVNIVTFPLWLLLIIHVHSTHLKLFKNLQVRVIQV